MKLVGYRSPYERPFSGFIGATRRSVLLPFLTSDKLGYSSSQSIIDYSGKEVAELCPCRFSILVGLIPVAPIWDFSVSEVHFPLFAPEQVGMHSLTLSCWTGDKMPLHSAVIVAYLVQGIR